MFISIFSLTNLEHLLRKSYCPSILQGNYFRTSIKGISLILK